ncbi:Uu.00g137560.m01.CDS01 [Anthostomella pinea]|uniref:Uu.00g137560.m01.CDS01 n=1 Tax=Anthostomella pinea TaxID=933095 RepID=A0AAI8VPL1_9PEZI|nr:Uu.00g137560.m01.CDS01 [Anthostomella pinea]
MNGESEQQTPLPAEAEKGQVPSVSEKGHKGTNTRRSRYAPDRRTQDRYPNSSDFIIYVDEEDTAFSDANLFSLPFPPSPMDVSGSSNPLGYDGANDDDEDEKDMEEVDENEPPPLTAAPVAPQRQAHQHHHTTQTNRFPPLQGLGDSALGGFLNLGPSHFHNNTPEHEYQDEVFISAPNESLENDMLPTNGLDGLRGYRDVLVETVDDDHDDPVPDLVHETASAGSGSPRPRHVDLFFAPRTPSPVQAKNISRRRRQVRKVTPPPRTDTPRRRLVWRPQSAPNIFLRDRREFEEARLACIWYSQSARRRPNPEIRRFLRLRRAADSLLELVGYAVPPLSEAMNDLLLENGFDPWGEEASWSTAQGGEEEGDDDGDGHVDEEGPQGGEDVSMLDIDEVADVEDNVEPGADASGDDGIRLQTVIPLSQNNANDTSDSSIIIPSSFTPINRKPPKPAPAPAPKYKPKPGVPASRISPSEWRANQRQAMEAVASWERKRKKLKMSRDSFHEGKLEEEEGRVEWAAGRLGSGQQGLDAGVEVERDPEDDDDDVQMLDTSLIDAQMLDASPIEDVRGAEASTADDDPMNPSGDSTVLHHEDAFAHARAPSPDEISIQLPTKADPKAPSIAGAETEAEAQQGRAERRQMRAAIRIGLAADGLEYNEDNIRQYGASPTQLGWGESSSDDNDDGNGNKPPGETPIQHPAEADPGATSTVDAEAQQRRAERREFRANIKAGLAYEGLPYDDDNIRQYGASPTALQSTPEAPDETPIQQHPAEADPEAEAASLVDVETRRRKAERRERREAVKLRLAEAGLECNYINMPAVGADPNELQSTPECGWRESGEEDNGNSDDDDDDDDGNSPERGVVRKRASDSSGDRGAEEHGGEGEGEAVDAAVDVAATIRDVVEMYQEVEHTQSFELLSRRAPRKCVDESGVGEYWEV